MEICLFHDTSSSKPKASRWSGRDAKPETRFLTLRTIQSPWQPGGLGDCDLHSDRIVLRTRKARKRKSEAAAAILYEGWDLAALPIIRSCTRTGASMTNLLPAPINARY